MNIRFIIMMSMLFLKSIDIIAQSNFPPKEFRVKEDIIVQFERSNGTVYQHNKGMDNWIELSNTNDKDGFAKLAANGRDYRGRSATIYTDNSGQEFKSYDGTH